MTVHTPIDAAPLLLVERPEPGIALLTLNRPQTRNALSRAMMTALSEAIEAISAEPDVAAIVLVANGTAFCAGHDLKELTAHRVDNDAGAAFYAATMTQCAGVMQGIVACAKPVIAAVEGIATAAGCQLVATCDLAVASETATFSTPGVNIGLFCSTPMVAMTRNMPRKRVMEMLLLGEALGAHEAAQFGLVNRVVPQGQVRETAFAFARTIAAKSKATVATGKSAFYAQVDQPLDEAYAYAAEIMTRNMLHADAREGIGAFLDKRKPKWSGC
jgi:enoyl-CoA hydratase/carnithine racemase